MIKKSINSLISVVLIIMLTSGSIIFNSCQKNEVLPPSNLNANNPSKEKVGVVVALAIIGAVVTIVTEVLDGQYHHEVIHNSDGSTVTRTWCEGVFGTCSMPSSTNNGGSVTIGEGTTVSERADYKINAELLNTNLGILYAINKKEENIKRFFYADKINISGTLLINNPDILSKLMIKKPIKIHGDYKVYQSEKYVFIKILEKK